ncbi:MAG: flagellar basal body-associated FliL family protein [Alphaproteobacteria bacterium]|nr:flagellar basal body-associated FliL family protein [Alphaproteobacteria bacterium]
MAKEKPKPEGDREEGDGEKAEGAKGRFNLKFILLFVVAPVLLLAVAGGGAYFFLFSGGESTQTADAGHGTDEHGAGEHGADDHGTDEHGGGGDGHGGGAGGAFFDLPEILVNLNSTADRPTFLKLSVALELKNPEAGATIESLMPRVIDNFQIYLRELRLEDLQGSAGMFRLKEELVRRVNLAIAPAEVKDVLFKEMIIQ